jgi:hypothetical protein
VIERSNTVLNLPEWTVDQLPEVRADRQITLTDTAEIDLLAGRSQRGSGHRPADRRPDD